MTTDSTTARSSPHPTPAISNKRTLVPNDSSKKPTTKERPHRQFYLYHLLEWSFWIGAPNFVILLAEASSSSENQLNQLRVIYDNNNDK